MKLKINGQTDFQKLGGRRLPATSHSVGLNQISSCFAAVRKCTKIFKITSPPWYFPLLPNHFAFKRQQSRTCMKGTRDYSRWWGRPCKDSRANRSIFISVATTRMPPSMRTNTAFGSTTHATLKQQFYNRDAAYHLYMIGKVVDVIGFRENASILAG